MWLHSHLRGSHWLRGLVSSWSRRYRCPWGTGRWWGEVRPSTTSWGHVPLACPAPLPCFLRANLLLVVVNPSMWFSQLTSPPPPPRAPNFSKATVTAIKLDLWPRSSQTSWNLGSQIGFLPALSWKNVSLAYHWRESIYQVEAGAFPYHTIWALRPALPGAWISLPWANQVPCLLKLHRMWFFPWKPPY